MKTPRRQTRELLKHLTLKETKKFLFNFKVIKEALRRKHKVQCQKDKKNFAKVLGNETLKKY